MILKLSRKQKIQTEDSPEEEAELQKDLDIICPTKLKAMQANESHAVLPFHRYFCRCIECSAAHLQNYRRNLFYRN